jgi:hypothetical protein
MKCDVKQILHVWYVRWWHKNVFGLRQSCTGSPVHSTSLQYSPNFCSFSSLLLAVWPSEISRAQARGHAVSCSINDCLADESLVYKKSRLDVVSGIPLLSPVCSDHHVEYVFRVLSVFPQGAGRTECLKSSVLALLQDTQG